MKEKVKVLFAGKKKLITIPAIPILAILALPFVIPSVLGFLVHKKVGSTKLRYALIGLIALIGLTNAPSYYANLVSPSKQPVTESTITKEVKGAEAATPTLTIPPTNIPAPTNTPILTLVPTNTPFPTKTYIAPTKAYVAPTQIPAQPQATQNSGLSNDDYYTNVNGNQVHSPAHSDTVPNGASAQCADGTYSFSQNRRGTCSGHGGVATWL